MFRATSHGFLVAMRRYVLLPMFACLLLSGSARAQSVASGAIQGYVTDESGAAMPGVTVTVTSPALQVPSIAVTTEADGAYRVPDLPAGVYQVTFELSGFQKFVRSELQLAVGFVAKVDA